MWRLRIWTLRSSHNKTYCFSVAYTTAQTWNFDQSRDSILFLKFKSRRISLFEFEVLYRSKLISWSLPGHRALILFTPDKGRHTQPSLSTFLWLRIILAPVYHITIHYCPTVINPELGSHEMSQLVDCYSWVEAWWKQHDFVDLW